MIQPLVGSTTQRRRWTWNPLAGLGPDTMSILTPALAAVTSRDQYARTINKDVSFEAVHFLGVVEPVRTGHR